MKTIYSLLMICMFMCTHAFSQSITGAQKYNYKPKDTVRIYGSNFNTSSSSVFIRLKGTYIKPLSLTSTVITFIAPGHVYSGKVTYQDTSNKKLILSRFSIQISTPFQGATSIDRLSFRQEKSVTIDSFQGSNDWRSHFADLDNDGVNEMITMVFYSQVQILKKKNGNFKRVFNINADEQELYAINDFNMDGKLDIITFGNYNSVRQMIFWKNTSTSSGISFSKAFSRDLGYDDVSFTTDPMKIVDFNGDGRHDIYGNYHYGLTDSFIFLNKPDTMRSTKFIKIAPDSNMVPISNLRPVHLNGDSLTDFIGLSYPYGTSKSKIYFLLNTSKGDKVKFKLVDSLDGYDFMFEYNEQDFNGDHQNDLFLRLWNSTASLITTHVLLNESTSSTFKLKRLAGNQLNPRDQFYTYFWDYNFDSIPDMFFSKEDSVFCNTMKIRNDSLLCTQSLVSTSYNGSRMLGNIEDINNDNQPDLVCSNSWRRESIDFALSEAYGMQLTQAKFTFIADSLKQVFHDSIELTYQSGRSLKLDSLRCHAPGIRFYKSASYTSALTFPIQLVKDSTYKFYFSYKFSGNRKDSVFLNNFPTLQIGIIQAKTIPPCAVISQIDKTLARPGDTITLQGQYFFDNIKDISVRINNRRCTVLGSSTATKLKIIYPGMASAATILITDTVKHYNVYSRQTIYPTFRQDTGQSFTQSTYTSNLYNYRDYVYTSYAGYQNHFELPAHLNTGNPMNTNHCLSGNNDYTVIAIGQVELKPYLGIKDYTTSRFNFTEDIRSYLYNKYNYNDGQTHMMDVNADGKLDFSDLNDSSKIFFCNRISDTSVEYGEKTFVPVGPNPGGLTKLNLMFTQPLDFDMDGNLDYMTMSPNNDSIYFFNYDRESGELVYLNYVPVEPGNYIFSVSDYTNDGKPDISYITYANTHYRYYYKENTSSKGMFRFSNKKTILIDSTISTNLSFHQYDLDRNGNVDILTYDNYGQYRVYLADSTNGSTYTLLDSFKRQEPFYKYGDLDGDGRPEMFGLNNVFRYKIENGKFKVYQLDLPSFNYMNSTIEDVNGDHVPDIAYVNTFMLNTISSATFGEKTPALMESPDYLKTSTNNLTLYNNGSKNIHLKNLTSTDTHYYFRNSAGQHLSYPILIKPKDSLVFQIAFKPAIRLEKFYKTLVEAHFSEDMPIVCKQVWGYVNLSPIITKVLPKILIPGDTAAIIGRNFDNARSAPLINFADARAEIIAYDDTLILVKIPGGAMDGVVTVFDTTTDLTGFSPEPLNYSFLGTTGPITENSFKRFHFATHSYGFFLNDYNADGLPDILYDSSNNISQNHFVNFNQSDFSGFKFNKEDVNANFGFYTTYLRKDVDGDGILDYISVFQGNTSSRFTAYYSGSRNGPLFENSTLPPMECITTDLNKNGKLEFNFGNYGAQSSFYEYNVKTPGYDECNDYIVNEKKVYYSPKPIGNCVFDYDFDGDGIGELLFEDTAITVAFNKCRKDTFDYTGALRLSIPRRNGYNVADMNNDGKLDIVTVTQASPTGIQQLCIFRNTSTKGNLSFSRYMDTMPRLYYWNDYFHLRDLNGDQKPEVIVFNSNLTDSFIIMTNGTSGNNFSFDKFCRIRTKGKVGRISEADMNADTKTDLVVQTDSGIFIYRNISISGFLSRNSYTFNQKYGFPLSLSLAIYNDGGDTLIIDKIKIPAGYKLYHSGPKFNFTGGSNSLGAEVTLPIKINVADSFQFYIVQDENALPGKYKDTFLFYNNQGSAPYRFILQGEIKPAPLAKLRKTSIDFGTHKLNRTASDSFYLRNIGKDTLKLASVKVTDTTHFKLQYDKSRKYILTGDSMLFKARFIASGKGSFNADLTIRHNDYIGLSNVTLDGTCIAPEIKDSVIIDFGDVYARTPASKTAILKNTGNDTLFITDIRHVNKSIFFSSASKGSKDWLLPGDSISVTATFSPDSIRSYRDQVSMTHNATNTTSKIVLKGNGVAAHLLEKTKTIDLGLLKTGRTYKFTYNVNNDGNRKLKIRNFSTGSNWLAASVCTGNPDSIAVSNRGSICVSIVHNQTGIFNDTLMIYNSGLDTVAKWHFKARFIQASSSAAISHSVYQANIFRNDTGSFIIYNTGDDTLSGVSYKLANAPGFLITDPAGFNGSILPGQNKLFKLQFTPVDTVTRYGSISISFGNDTGKLLLGITGKGLKGIPFVSKKNISVTVSLNKTGKAFQSIRNTGNTSLKITGVQHQNTLFAASVSKTVLAPGDTAQLEISFSPLTYQKWHYDKVIVTSVSDSISYSDTLLIDGKCLYPEIQLSRTGSIQFPDTKTKTSALDSVVISNTGDDTLRVQISALGAFEQVTGSGSFVIQPMQKLSSVIRFTPLLQKTYIDSFNITSNTQTGEYRYIVKGTGIFNRNNYPLIISRNNIDFGDVFVGVKKTDSFELSNTGTDTLNLLWNTIDLPFKNERGSSGIQLLPGQKKQVPVSFQPGARASYADTILITNMYQDSLCVMTLSGNGYITYLKDLSALGIIRVYPNPARDVLEIHLENGQEYPLLFQLFDMTGKEISPEYTSGRSTVYIQTRNLSDGVYMLYIPFEGINYRMKVVVQH